MAPRYSWFTDSLTGDTVGIETHSALDDQVAGDHYKTLKIQPIEYIVGNDLGWCEGNIVKYITRWKQKGGLDDIDKVIHYAEMLKEFNSE